MPRTRLSLPFDGTRLRQWRERAGLTQQQLADACSLSRFQISRWETHNARPEPDSLPLLVQGLARALTDANVEGAMTFGLNDLLDSSPEA